MSQSSTVPLQTPPPKMKGKVIAAILAVVVGHVGVLCAVSQMKVPELPQIKKEPLKVKFVKIKEDIPPPPPPAEPIVKPKVKPVVKPKEKPVEKPVKAKAEPKPVEKKIVATKTEKVEQKKVQQDDTLEKQKLEQQKIEQQRQDQLRKDQEAKDQAARDQAKRDQEAKDQAKREQDERDRQRREQEDRSRPRIVKSGQVSWRNKPTLVKERVAKFMTEQDGLKTVNLEITADAKGSISDVRVIQSSGIPELDNYVVKQTRATNFKPYLENGVAVPFKIRQDFTLSVSKK